MRARGVHPGLLSFAATAVWLTSSLLVGCNNVRTAHSARAGAPSLSDDAPLGGRGGANPNAPYMVVDHSAHLVTRPTQLDMNAAPACVAADLSLFESGAHIDGDRRSVRLNLVNHADHPCQLSGYPAIALVRADGSLIGTIAIEKTTATTLQAALLPAASPASAQPATTNEAAAAPPAVLLAPAAEAAFEVGWSSSEDGQPCDQVGAISVSAPGTTQSFTVRHNLRVCQGRIQVTAVTDGNQL